MATELATAYISLSANTKPLANDLKGFFKDLDRQGAAAGKKITGGIDKELSRGSTTGASTFGRRLSDTLATSTRGSGNRAMSTFQTEAQARGARIGTAVGTVIGKGMGAAISVGIAGAATVATAAVATLGTALTKGFTRLKNIDTATYKLKALGNSAADIQKIMQSAKEAVKGTSFGLDAAANTAANAVAADVPLGQLTDYLNTVADAAAIAETSLDEMGSIFNKVQTNGKAMTDDLQMLADRGLPIFTWLKNQYGVTGEELEKMVEDSKVSSADFLKVIQTNIGGAGKIMGQSFSGSIQNAEAALGRLGEALLKPVFGQAAGGIGSVTTALDDLTAWVNNHQADIIGFWTNLGTGAVSATQEVLQATAEMIGAFGGLQDFLGNILGGMNKFQAWQADFRGDHETADQLREQAEEFFAWGNSAKEAEARIRSWIENLDSTKGKIEDWGERAKDAAKLSQALGDTIVSIPDGKTILLQDNVPEVDQKLEALGLKVTTLPDGKVTLVPNTPEAQKLIDAFLAKNNPTDPVTTPVEVETERAEAALQAFRDRMSKPLVIGVDILPGQTPSFPPGTIAPDDLGGLLGAGGNAPAPGPGPLPSGISGGGGVPGGPTAGFPNATPGSPSRLFGTAGNSQVGLTTASVDAIAQRFGLTKTSGLRPGDGGYHGSGQAGDYSGSPQQMQQFAAYMSRTFGKGLLELIFDAPGWAGNVHNGAITGAFGNVYTMDQAGYHGDHVHVAVKGHAAGGAIFGPGSGTSDSIPAWLSNGEHVLTAKDVAAMGGHAGVYAFRNAIHRDKGGAIDWRLPGESKPGNNTKPGAWPPRAYATGGAAGAAQDISTSWDEEKWKQLLALNPGASPAQIAQQAMGTPHAGTGAAPGPRTEGYIPATAGNTAPVGQGGLSNFLDLGESAIHNLIDTGAQLGSMAVSAAAAAGSFGAGAAAGPAASTAIQMGAEAAKRGVTYGYDMAGIWGEALVEQVFPFGAPRWLGSANPMAFMPQWGPQEGQKEPGTMGKAAESIQSWAQPANPAMDMGTGAEGAQAALGLAKQQPSYTPTAQTQPAQPAEQPPLFDPKAIFGFDEGGWLEPGMVGANFSNKPEPVFNAAQWKQMEAYANSTPVGKGDTNQFYAQDVEGMFREYEKSRRREARTYSSRP
ncbi:tape measure protein [Mycolicibacterium austroafricanum]|uniref:tape measure protein n=1 Tax=Mycolicibacterium austroafricanum TaxID=39687 RepID=UPI001CA384A4|nr:tape measure protein [Mycolicibacterium austroafricanum]QZT61241.1 hypothetical protein JN085_19940 [Mycolicibacterium austroafricanum]